MNFLKHVDSVFKKNKHAYAGKYFSNTLSDINVSNNKFKFDFIFNDKNSPEFLALNNPIQFIYKYLNQETIDKAIRINPEISVILKENNLSFEYEIKNVSSIIASHLLPTSRYAQIIYQNMNKIIEYDELTTLVQASLIHDIGKIFIPKEILNKTGRLTLNERKIIELHNKLSFEILITTNLNQKVAHLAWQHHDYENSFKRTMLNQILMIADIYSALKETRPYRKALNNLTAKTILYDMGASGKFDVGYIRYLCV